MPHTPSSFGLAPEAEEANSAFALERWPFYWITRTNSMYLNALEKVLKKSNLDIPEWRVLMLLNGEQARSISYLATEAVIKLSTMTRIIGRMEKDGLVETRQAQFDARVTEAYLTKKGFGARHLAWAHAIEVIESAFENVADEDVDHLMATLSKVFDNLQKMTSP